MWPLLGTPWLADWVASKRKGAPQESSHQMQLSQMGFGQGGERLNKSSSQVNDRGNHNAQSANQGVPSKGHIVIPYTQGLCESIKKICGRYGIQTHFKGGRTIKNLLVSPKDKDPMVNQSGAIYWYQCGDLGCDDEYIGETSRAFGWKIQRAPEGPLCHSPP